MMIRVDADERQVWRLVLMLVLFELCLSLIFITSSLLGMKVWIVHRLFDMDGEQNIPAWFSSVQLFAIGLVFLLKIFDTNPTPAIPRYFLLLVGLGFIFLSADEAAGIHEQISQSLNKFGGLPGFKGGHGYWVAVYGAIAVTLALSNLRPAWNMWTQYRRASTYIAVGMSLIVAGAMGLEIISYQFLRDGDAPMLYMLEVAGEEFLEMAGASVVLCGALQLLLPDQRT